MSDDLIISPDSDDRIGIRFDEVDDCVYAGECEIEVTLPDGTELPIRVSYNQPWDITIGLPAGSTVVVGHDG